MNLSSLASSLARRCIISPKTRRAWTASSLTLNRVTESNALKPSARTQPETLSSLTLQTRPFLTQSKAASSLLPILNSLSGRTVIPPLNSPFTQSTRSFASQKHKRVIKMAKGYRGRSKNTFRAALRRVEKGLQYAYRDRKVKKRNFRKLWIERTNAGVRQHGLSYSRFMAAMKNLEGGKEILLDRKVLSELAGNEPFSFKAVVDVVKATTTSSHLK